MNTLNEIARLRERQIVLSATMAKSDPHLWGCLKKLLDAFRENYPEDYAEYLKANEEYNANEAKIRELEMQAEAEEVMEMHETPQMTEE